jgi:zinc protease
VRRLPLVSIRFVLDVGARQESKEQAGVAALAASALAEGTERLDAGALAEEFERLGGAMVSYATWDATHVRTTVLTSRLERALSLLAEVIRTPAFRAREVERLKEERLAELLELRSEPRGLADERFNSWLYKSTSRLSVQEAGSERSVGWLTRDACRAWHASQFAPAVTALVVAGDVYPAEVVRLATNVLGDWSAPTPAELAVDDAPANTTSGARLVHRADAPQSELRLGHVGLRRATLDYFDVVVMNAILGGVFNSRINLNLREKNAFTYGAFSSFEWRRDAGPFQVSTAVATAVTAPAIREVLWELERIQQGPPSADELTLSTSYLDGVFPIRFETTDAIAGALASIPTLRLPDDYYDTYRDRIRAVTAEDVLKAARSHIHLDRLQVLAVGDREHVLPSLGEMPLGPVSVVSDDDE